MQCGAAAARAAVAAAATAAVAATEGGRRPCPRVSGKRSIAENLCTLTSKQKRAPSSAGER